MKSSLSRFFSLTILSLALISAPFQARPPTYPQSEAFSANSTRLLIEDFESPDPLSNWYPFHGTSASGKIFLVNGSRGQSGCYSFNLAGATPGEAYFGAYHPLDQPLFAVAISFWIKSPPGAWIMLRAQDSTDQTLQYSLARPFGAYDSQAWYRHIVELDPSSVYWGGANDGVFHPPLKGLSILTSEVEQAHLIDQLEIDDIYIIDSSEYNLWGGAVAPGAARSGSAQLESRLGVNIHFTQDNLALDIIKSAGFSFVRMDFPWADIELTKGVYNFTKYDQLVDDLQGRGMGVLWIINQGNPLYTADWRTPATTPEAITAFGNFAQASAQHYAGRPVRWEIWNEPNLANFWPPAADPNQYATLAQETITRMHQGDPNAIVSTAGLSGYSYDFLRAYLNTDCCKQADAIGSHPYGVPFPEMVSDNLPEMRQVVDQLVPGTPPLWDTEWGYTSAYYGNGHSTEARFRQAIMVARELLSAWAVGYPLMVYYDIRDDGTDPYELEHNFGLLANNYTDKPAMTAVRTLSAQAANRQLVGYLDTSPTTLHALRLDGAQDMLIILWSASPGNQVKVFLTSASVKVISFLGQDITPTPSPEGAYLLVSESDGPVYITLPYPGKIYLPLVEAH